jgi:hypothetical protein
MPQWPVRVGRMMTLTEKRWLADHLRKLAAEEALAGADNIAAEYLIRAEAVETGRDHWRIFQPRLQ